MVFILCFSIVIPGLLKRVVSGYLFHLLHKSRCFSLKENKAGFLETQNLIFSIVAISILFCYCLRLSILIYLIIVL